MIYNMRKCLISIYDNEDFDQQMQLQTFVSLDRTVLSVSL